MADTTDVKQPSDEGAAQPITARHSSSRLNQALAWVGIVAGGLFIVAAVFFAGFFLNYSEHMHMNMGMSHAAMGHDSKDCCADMKPGDHMMKPGAVGPAMMSPHAGR
ncbi:MAG: hypothetical protein QOD34_2959 [Mycobacterium sp.]|jgi:hypothetical protein|nr:hypothetical protein [Mycobacterium sp.]